jgi:hypothetical protein
MKPFSVTFLHSQRLIDFKQVENTNNKNLKNSTNLNSIFHNYVLITKEIANQLEELSNKNQYEQFVTLFYIIIKVFHQ